ncbi:MAG: hypothetical protein K2M31_01860 [Muribaculaceae bacterium]|nr:hypothetical protein [Muribaculaceae bacterium]
MAKRLLGMMLAAVLGIFVTKAQNLVYDGITPSPGSEISSFDFVLKFDLSKVIETNGEGEYGVGYIGYHNDKRPQKEQSVTIYKGTQFDNVVIGRCNYTALTGGMADFVPTSSEVAIHIEGLPEPGVEYTMVISNEFKVYKDNNPAPITDANFDCFTNPITYTFIGKAVSGEKLTVAGCSVTANQSIDILNEVTFTFSQPVSVNTAFPLVVKENGALYATSIDAVLSEDKTEVTYKFDNASLLNGHSYVISLPAGAVTSVSSSETNAEFNVSVTGSYVGHFELKSSIPTSEQKTIFSTVEGIFEMPEGMQILKGSGSSLNLDGTLYKGSVAEENLVGILKGESNSTNNGIIWTNPVALDPASTYILYMPSGQFRARDITTGKLSNDWYNGEANIVLRTPSVAESGISKVEFKEPVLGQFKPNGETLKAGDKVSSIDRITFVPADLKYSFEGETYPNTILETPSVLLYDITDSTPELLNSYRLSSSVQETTTQYYNVFTASLNTIFYEGHKYRLVLPAGSVTGGPSVIKNYSANAEVIIDFEGATPTKVELLSCSLAENSEMSELSGIVWKFKGNFVMNPDLSVRIFAGNTNSYYIPTFVSVLQGVTTVQAFDCNQDGTPATLRDGVQYRAILPEGLIYYAGDSSIRNTEYTIPFTGVAKAPVKPEYVDVNIITNNFMTTTQRGVKGETFTYSMGFDSPDWKLESASQGGRSLSVVNGGFVTRALNEDTSIDLLVEYKGAWATNEESTGIWTVPDSDIRIYSDGNFIVVEGVSPANTINVYNVAGMLVNTTHVSDGNDLVRLTVTPGQYYIVTVDGVAAKIKM